MEANPLTYLEKEVGHVFNVTLEKIASSLEFNACVLASNQDFAEQEEIVLRNHPLLFRRG